MVTAGIVRTKAMQWALVMVGLAIVAAASYRVLGINFERGSGHRGAKVAASKARATVAMDKSRIDLAGLPLVFEPNRGQTDPRVQFLAHSSRYNLFLTRNEAVFSLRDGASANAARVGKRRSLAEPVAVPTKSAVVRMQFLGAAPHATAVGGELAEGRSNYLHGHDPSRWVRNVPQYARVNYPGLYRRVDLTFYGREQKLEFDFSVSPGANPRDILLSFAGAEQVRTNGAGDLVLASGAGDLVLHKPTAYQRGDRGRELVDARFVVRNGHEVAFALGPYDRGRELVIDPSVVYSTYLGTSGNEEGLGIAVDTTGAAYVTGQTRSSAFPTTTGVVQKTSGGGLDAFITKFKPDGSGLVYSTYLGGSGDDSGNAIVVDGAGNAYMTGSTTSDQNSFPLSANAAQATFGGLQDAFVAEFDPAGANLLYSSFIGGSDEEVGNAIAIDGSGNIYVGGETKSLDFPPVVPLQGGNAGLRDGFVAKINASTGGFAYASYLGGSSGDLVTGIGVDSANNIYVTGVTVSTDFPRAGTPYQSQCGTDGKCNPNTSGPQDDSFVTAIKSDLTQYIYSTYLGGSGFDDAQGLAADASGNVFITGVTGSTDLKTVNPFQASLSSGSPNNAFVAELDPTGSTAKYLTYLGGEGGDTALGIALDAKAQNIYITGQTNSTKFPTVNPIQSAFAGKGDAFVSQLNPSASPAASQLVFSTYLGGSGAEDTQGGAVAVDSNGLIYITGDTGNFSTTPFPTINPFQAVPGGGTDAFVTKISPQAGTASFTIQDFTLSPSTIARGSSGTATITVTSVNNFAGSVNLTCSVAASSGTPASPPTCSLSAVTVQLTAGGTQQSTLTVATKAPTANLAPAVGFGLPLAGIAILGIGSVGAGRKLRALCFMGLIVMGLLFTAGCGGGKSNGGGGGGGGGGTTTGSYTVTITGASLGSTASSHASSFSVQ